MRFASGIGQYVPVASPVHRLDARVKLMLTVGFTVALFLVGGFPGLGALALVVAAGVIVSRVSPGLALRGVRAVLLVLGLTVGIQALRWGGPAATVAHVGPLGVSGPGLLRGLFFATRIVLLVVGSSLITLTTSPVELTDGMERLMRPLRIVRFPVHEIAMMLTIALRFIPTTAEEAERIVTAQTARGARFDSGGPVARARAWVPVLVPLFVTLFRRAETLAFAMEARCYRGGEGRTRLNEPVLRPADLVTLTVGIVIAVAVGVSL